MLTLRLTVSSPNQNLNINFIHERTKHCCNRADPCARPLRELPRCCLLCAAFGCCVGVCVWGGAKNNQQQQQQPFRGKHSSDESSYHLLDTHKKNHGTHDSWSCSYWNNWLFATCVFVGWRGFRKPGFGSIIQGQCCDWQHCHYGCRLFHVAVLALCMAAPVASSDQAHL